jgi:hypothetical protein
VVGDAGQMMQHRTLQEDFRAELAQIKSNQIKSNQIKSNQIKSNQIKSNQIKAKSIGLIPLEQEV